MLKEYKEHIYKILQKLQDIKLLVKPEKSKFYIKEVNYLKYTIKPRQIIMQVFKVEAIKY